MSKLILNYRVQTYGRRGGNRIKIYHRKCKTNNNRSHLRWKRRWKNPIKDIWNTRTRRNPVQKTWGTRASRSRTVYWILPNGAIWIKLCRWRKWRWNFAQSPKPNIVSCSCCGCTREHTSLVTTVHGSSKFHLRSIHTNTFSNYFIVQCKQAFRVYPQLFSYEMVDITFKPVMGTYSYKMSRHLWRRVMS